MQIRVLTFDGCPSCDATFALVKQVVDKLGLGVAVDHVQVHNESEAAAQGFFGSPSVQIDGKDIEPGRREDTPSFGCRLYVHQGRRTGVPPKEMIVNAILESEDRA